MYLYIFEDGTLGQSQHPPTADDMVCIGDGILQVISLVGSKFVETDSTAASAAKVSFRDIREIDQAQGWSE